MEKNDKKTWNIFILQDYPSQFEMNVKLYRLLKNLISNCPHNKLGGQLKIFAEIVLMTNISLLVAGYAFHG